MTKIVILTGAGISAESGLGTFRDEDGLWAKHRIEDVATPEGFDRNPQLVHHFYNERRRQAAVAQPNAAHIALAQLERDPSVDLLIVTQNVDTLHEAAGAQQVWHMHGQLDQALCGACGHRWAAPEEMQSQDPCPACSAAATRPDVVWFGEMPYHMDQIWDQIRTADIFAAIGTSGQVYPAAAFGQDAQRAGVHTVELNLAPSATVSDFSETHFGPATQVVPNWAASLCTA
ncbi:MAG: NAD-dependent deacylase [Thalassovita sp.]